jgi:dTDP-4-dehydrorhamnose 3,5-epimerase
VVSEEGLNEMKFLKTKLEGAYVIEAEPMCDERGFFARTFCKKEFLKHGLDFNVAQCNTSYNKTKTTLRGMHYQAAPYQEVKVVSCIKGAIYDVIVDLRPDSPTYCQWFSIELTPDNWKMLYVPKGFAHGYQTLQDDTVVSYLVSEFYQPGSEKVVRWNDPAFGISWPLKPQIISSKDSNHPDFVK